jgi:hypothetical protein
MATSTWCSVTDSVASRDCDITDESGAGIPASHFLRSIADLPGDGPTNGSTRWAIVIGEDGFLKLQWQALPLPASILNGKAIFKRLIRFRETGCHIDTQPQTMSARRHQATHQRLSPFRKPKPSQSISA